MVKLALSSFRLFGLAGLSLIGFGILLIFGLIGFFFVYNFSIVKFIVGIVLGIWMIFTILIGFLHMFQYFHLFSLTGLWEGIFGVFLIRDSIHERKMKKSRKKTSFKTKQTKIKAISLSVMFLLGAILFVSPFYSKKTYTFEVTDTQAQNYELVLYLPATTEAVNACRDANATLSFNMVQSLFNISNPTGMDYANIVDYANQEGVSIEIWPLFDSGGYHYISARNTVHLWALYHDFHNWTEYHNITVDYVLWDIEDWIQKEDLNYTGWACNIPVLNTIGNLSMYGIIFQENLRNWSTIIDE